jgi:hypothetical protein
VLSFFASGRVGTACQPRSSPQGELGRGKASPCTPAEEGAAKPRPYLMPFKSVICTLYSTQHSAPNLYTFAQAAGRFALLHCPIPRSPVPLFVSTARGAALLIPGRVGTACQPRSSPQGELGRGKASPCTPAEEGAAKPRPYLMPFKSVICTLYSTQHSAPNLFTFAQAAGRFALLHCLSPGPRFPFSLGQPCYPYLFLTHPINLLNQRVGWAADPRRSRRRTRISWRPNIVA